MGFLLPIISAVSGVVGIVSGIKGLTQSQKSSAPPAPAPLPEKLTIEGAATDAKAESAKRRRISLLSGGNTDITRGSALVPEGSIGRKTLLGQ